MIETRLLKLGVFWRRICPIMDHLRFVSKQSLLEIQLHIRWWIFVVISKFKYPAKTGEHSVILSLTTYPKRTRYARKALKSIILQNPLRFQIFVFVFADEHAQVSRALSSLSPYSVEVVPFEENLRQYLKIIPALKHFENNAIITFDDDILYPLGWLEGLVKAHQANPNLVIGYRGQHIPPNENLGPESYFSLQLFKSPTPIVLDPERILFTGVGGVLYPPKVFCSLAIDMQHAQELSPGNDDLWLHYISIHNRTQKLFIPSSMGEPLFFLGSQTNALWKSNDVGAKRNYDALTKLSRNFIQIQCLQHHSREKGIM